jgi:hypothetical protein
MATVIDSLLVTLGLDATNFKKGQADADKAQKDFVTKSKRSGKELSDLDSKAATQRAKNSKEMQAQGKQAVETFSKMRNQALSLLAVFTAGMGIVEFAKSTIFTTAALGRLSKNVGISVSDLAGWGIAAKETGGSAEGMMADINKASQALAHFRTGIPDAGLNAYFQFGGGTEHGELKDTQSYLLAISDLLHTINATDPAKAQMAATAMGISYDSFNLMKQGSAALREKIALDAKLSAQTQQNADDAQKAQKSWVDLEESLSSVGRTVLFNLSPAFDELGGFLHALNDPDFWDILFPRLEKLASWINSFRKFTTPGGWVELVKDAISGNGDNKSSSQNEASGKIKNSVTGTPKSTGASSASRGIRNNNPGNIRYGAFAQRHGAVGQDKDGFAIFPSMAVGEAASQALLGIKLSSGKDTIRKVISSWAPASENKTEDYIAAVSKQTGIGADQKLNGSSIPSLAQAIYRHENGSAYSVSPSLAGLNRNPGRAGSVSNSTSSSEVHVGQVTVVTQATDAHGIAKDIGGAFRSSGFLVGQANTGMQ